MFGLACALKEIPTGTAYAVWVGIGATLAVAYGMMLGGESISPIKIVLILGCVIGLKAVN